MEGISRVLDRLTSHGHAFFTTWLENPPRSGVRLVALCIETLRARKIANPSRHLIAFRSWSTLSILMSREPFDAAAIVALKKFCDENAFDLVWFDGIKPDETNRVNVIPDDPYYESFKALLGPHHREFVRASPFAIDPPTDDRPFFNQYFRWAAMPQWISTMGMSWLPFVEWGYILHVATLLVVAMLGLVILIVPCLATRARPRARIGFLFFALGTGYMFVEIWAIYKVTELVAHPLLGSALVLSVMLASSGAGALVLGENQRVRPACAFIFLCGALAISILVLPSFMRFAFVQSIWVRAAIAIGWVTAPAFFMGFPFPYALARLSRESEVPWALALNGFGSVLGSLVATLVAVHFGFIALGIAALGFYIVVVLLCRNGFGKGDARESFPL
jgi:hypothetical protein